MTEKEIFSQHWTPPQLERMRADSLLMVKPDGHDSFTCDSCGLKETCMFVYDPYNTQGDCLAFK